MRWVSCASENVIYAIVHPSGSFGSPSAPRSNPGGNGPMISAGGEPYSCICDKSTVASVRAYNIGEPQRMRTSCMSSTIFRPFCASSSV